MKHQFTLPDFPFGNFEIETSIWTRKSKLFMNNVELEKSGDKGNPYLIPRGDGSLAMAFAKKSFPNFELTIEIDGKFNKIFEKLKWYEYVVAFLPLLLFFIGGALGGVLGLMASYKNVNVFRQEGNEILKYAEVIGVTALTGLLQIIIIMLITLL